jgi:hypothetical protein
MARIDRSSALTWLYLACCVTGFAWFLMATGDFNNDDLDNFTTIRNGELLRLMVSPLHGHWSPFHRFSTWLVYTAAPMRFEVAVLMLMIFHAGTLAYLGATLRQFGLGLSGKVILCVYASCGLLLYGMIWWANAQLRVPHALLCAAAIFHYLAWLKGGRKLHLALAAGAFLIDLCVYQKSVLVPVYMGVIGFLAAPGKFRDAPVRAALLPLLLFLVSVAFVIAYMMLSKPQPHPGIAAFLSIQWSVFKAFIGALIGVTSYDIDKLDEPTTILMQWGVGLFWLSLLLVSLRLAPRTWKIWLAMLLMVGLDFLPLTSSSRTYFFGPLVAYSYRYHYESVYLVAIFAGLICASTLQSRAERGIVFLHKRVLAVAIVASYAVVNVVAVGLARSGSFEFDISRRCHAYMGNLRNGLAWIREPAPVFRDSEVPKYMAILVGPDKSSQIVPLFIPGARFDARAKSYYRVEGSGKVVQVIPASR